jgi:FeS assembly SUF system regulator
MIRMTRLTDYGIVLLVHFARHPEMATRNARELAAHAHLPTPSVSKILKKLAREGILASHRGINGGFSLARPLAEISIADIIKALEGPIAITECNTSTPCELEQLCPVGSNWKRINQAILGALQITLEEMAKPLGVDFMARPLGSKSSTARPGDKLSTRSFSGGN